MIVVKVELWSAISGHRTELARMVIDNVGGTHHLGDYRCRTLRGRSEQALDGAMLRMDRGGAQRAGEVLQHPRLREHVWNLVAKALAAMAYGDAAYHTASTAALTAEIDELRGALKRAILAGNNLYSELEAHQQNTGTELEADDQAIVDGALKDLEYANAIHFRPEDVALSTPSEVSEPDKDACHHEAWEDLGGGRRCADCAEWLSKVSEPDQIGGVFAGSPGMFEVSEPVAETGAAWASPSLGRAYAEVERVRDAMAQPVESGIDEAFRTALEAIEAADCELTGIAS